MQIGKYIDHRFRYSRSYLLKCRRTMRIGRLCRGKPIKAKQQLLPRLINRQVHRRCPKQNRNVCVSLRERRVSLKMFFFSLAIKLSESAFSAMKDRIGDENNENDSGEIKVLKPTATVEKTSSVKPTKPKQSTSTTLTLKQALQNVSVLI